MGYFNKIKSSRKFCLASIMICFFISILPSCAQTSQSIQLTIHSKSEYQIYIPQELSELKIQVKDLQDYIYKISNARLPIVHDKNEDESLLIIDVLNNVKNRLKRADYNDLKPGGFLIITEGTNIIITAKDKTGISNGIYTFLEQYLGCRFYALNAIKVPQNSTIVLKSINDLQNPAFEFAAINSFTSKSAEFCRWHKLEQSPRDNSRWLKPWIHTTTNYLDPKDYFSTHPEYYMLHNGVRTPKEIDFSSTAALNQMTKNIQEKLKKYPDAKYIGVSQADGNPQGICRGQECQRIKNQAGASAVILNFANQIAEHFPDKTITTLAYWYTQKPPTIPKYAPKDNVLVILCNTEKNRNKATQLTKGNPFYGDLLGWQNLTNNILVWDYVANFVYPGMPYPNFHLIQKNIKRYEELGVTKLFEQMNSQRGSNFEALRSYLLAKLLWNPDADVEIIINDFLEGYYGEAAPYIKEYIDKMTVNLKNSKRPLRRNAKVSYYKNSYLSLENLQTYEQLFMQSKKAVEGQKQLLERVDNLKQSLRFAQLQMYREVLKYSVKLKSNQNTIAKEKYNELLKEYISKLKQQGLYKISNRAKTPVEFRNLMQLENKKKRMK